jgi:predicted kinase
VTGDGGGRLIVLCGLPGSGKTTVARRLEDQLGGFRLCTDEWMTSLAIDLYDQNARERVDALQQDVAVELVGLGMTVVYESGGWTRAERDRLRERARTAGASVELRYLDEPIDVMWQRLADRNATRPWATGVISRDDLATWAAHFEAPTAAELALYDRA